MKYIFYFDKNAIFSAFCLKCFFFYENDQHSSVDEKRKNESKNWYIFIEQNILGSWKISEYDQKCWWWLET